jgi:hypothetical protein
VSVGGVVSLVSLRHPNLRHVPISSAGYWHVDRLQLRATTSAQGVELAHALFVTPTILLPWLTPQQDEYRPRGRAVSMGPDV